MTASTPEKRFSAATVGAYLLLLAAAVGIFFVIRHFGQTLTAGIPAAAGAEKVIAQKPTVDVVFHVLLTLAVIIAVGNALAWAFRKIGQPAVIGEVIAGILLGPSFLGMLSPDLMHCLVPDASVDPSGLVLASLKTIAQIGVVLYMFIVGMELNTHKLSKQAESAVAISHASIIFPFILGTGMALWLYPILSPSSVPFTSFALFLGVAMSITAFPVLARILTDLKIDQSELGVIALGCAAADDATAWCLLAFVVGVARAQVSEAVTVTLSTGAYIAFMFIVARPLIKKWVASTEKSGVDRQAKAILFVLLLCSACTTEWIGIHAVFGAFLLGAVIPHDSKVANELSRQLVDVVTILLLPAFFAVTGLNMRIGLISGVEDWVICLAILLVATIGKWGGTIAASRFVGFDWKTSNALGLLMNTRGLMELIVLNIGLSLGVITPKLFAMMVLMAIVTTMATSPLLRRLIKTGHDGKESAYLAS